LPRASNTVVQPGRDAVRDIMNRGGDGLLHVKALGSGEVDHRRGQFSLMVNECCFVAPGGDEVPLRDVTIFGDTARTLRSFESAAGDTAIDNVTCSKSGQHIGIGLASPSIRFGEITWRS
jgi:predicted Zn-dependent protease